MKKVDKIVDILKKILTDHVATNEPGVFHKYLGLVDRENFLKSSKALGTPQYLLDEAALRKRAEFFLSTFRKHIPECESFYAFKCNDFPSLIKILKESGFNADVAGIFELQLALKLGFEKIIFTGPGKSEEELDLVIKNSDKVILNIDNVDELIRLKKLITKIKAESKVKVSFRLNSGNQITKEWAKFGIHLSDFRSVYDLIVDDPNIIWAGIHFHASWNQDPVRYNQNIKLIGEYLKANFTKEELEPLEFIDIGGGFYPEDQATLTKESDKGYIHRIVKDYSHHEYGAFDPYQFFLQEVKPLEQFAKSIAFYLKKYIHPLSQNLKVFTEPGRFIATHSTAILLKVIATKKECVIVDGGINMVGDYRFQDYVFPIIMNVSRPSHKFNRKIIYGPLCDPSDLWGYSFFGDTLRKGDVIAVLHQGSYTFSCAWRFIKPTAKYVILTKEKELKIGKREESFDDRYSGCEF
jgi:diaminopimelate decarboxylase